VLPGTTVVMRHHLLVLIDLMYTKEPGVTGTAEARLDRKMPNCSA
jgi:hypothetical protein